MKFWKKLTILCITAGLFGLAACNKDYVGKENSHPLFQKGVSFKTSQNYLKAAESFEGFLSQCPKSARAHRELADLYSDFLNDYIKAVYHYEKYMEFAKLTNSDRQDIRRVIDSNKQKFYEKYQQETGQVPVSVNREAELAELNELKNSCSMLKGLNKQVSEKCKKFYDDLQTASDVNKKLAKQNEELRSQVAALSNRTGRGTSVRTSAQPRNPSAAVETAATYTIRPGDDLSKIAKKIYHGKFSWKQLYEANKAEIGPNPAKIKVGQVLRLPPAPAARTTPAPAATRTTPAAPARTTPAVRTVAPAPVAQDDSTVSAGGDPLSAPLD